MADISADGCFGTANISAHGPFGTVDVWHLGILAWWTFQHRNFSAQGFFGTLGHISGREFFAVDVLACGHFGMVDILALDNLALVLWVHFRLGIFYRGQVEILA